MAPLVQHGMKGRSVGICALPLFPTLLFLPVGAHLRLDLDGFGLVAGLLGQPKHGLLVPQLVSADRLADPFQEAGYRGGV